MVLILTQSDLIFVYNLRVFDTLRLSFPRGLTPHEPAQFT